MQIINIDIPYFIKILRTHRDEAMKLCVGDNDMENIYNRLEESRIFVEEYYKDKL